MSKKFRVIFMLILIGLMNPMLEHVEAESRRISGDKFFGCTDFDYHKKLTNYAVQKDMEAFTKSLTEGLLLGKCTLFKSGEEVFLDKPGACNADRLAARRCACKGRSLAVASRQSQ